MNYILIDLDKCQCHLHTNTRQQTEQLIYIFSKRHKKLRKMARIQKNNTYIETINCKHKKTYSCIIDKLKTILQQDHTAQIVILSQRKKLKKAILALAEVYNNANITLLKKLSKKYINLIKQKDNINNLQCQPLPPSESTPPISPSLFQAATQLLKKTRPKKKSDLLKILINHLHLQESIAQQLLIQLKNEHLICIDIAENIKYF